MPPMGAAHGRDIARMARRGEPVVDGSADRASANWRLAGSLVTRNEKNDALLVRHRLVERAVDCTPGSIEGHSMKIDDPVRFELSAREPPVPASVERFSRRPLLLRSLGSGCRARRHGPGYNFLLRCCFEGLRIGPVSRQRPDRRGNTGPEGGFLRAERPHARRRPWEEGHKRRRWRPCHRRSGWLRRPSPRRYRTYWVP